PRDRTGGKSAARPDAVRGVVPALRAVSRRELPPVHWRAGPVLRIVGGKGKKAAAAVGPLTREKASPTFARLPKGLDRRTESGAPPDRAGRTGYARYRGSTGDHGQ